MTRSLHAFAQRDDRLERAAIALDAAACQRQAREQFPAGSFTLDEAYRVQRLSMGLRLDRGEKVKGIKLGFTSRAKMVQMGVDALIWGWLTDAMVEEDGGSVALSRYIHPRVEPEVCFLTRRAIASPLTLLEAADHIEAVAPALEIIDSRYANFKFKLEDVVADNCSSAGLVVGPFRRSLTGLDNAGVRLQFNGRDVQVGSTAAILGNPLRAVVQASQLLHAAGLTLEPGALIMAGAATAAHALEPGVHVECSIGHGTQALGTVSFNTTAGVLS